MRKRKISKLWYQFKSIAPNCRDFEIAMALSDAGLIEVQSDRDGPSTYIETDKMREIDKAKFNAVIESVIRDFFEKHNAKG
jgi:hypothetical protein